ncbi:MAG: CotH kinase family protein, partial [Cryomorphaceae bacterium]|nr:CotH kinase family protein [Cryomorphaceae bacterium]
MKRLLQAFLLFIPLWAFSQQEGDNFNQYNGIHEIRLTFYQQNYWDSLIDGYAGDYYIKGDIEIDGTLLTNCGIKLKGNSSYNNPSTKKSFKLDFNEYVSGQNYDGLKKLNLNNNFKDPTMLREKLMYDFLNINGCYAPRAQFTNVYINNQLWGLYSTVEEIDKTFLSKTFNDDKGNLFKGDPTGDLKWLGNSQALYEPKYQDLDTIFDSENFIKTWAAHSLFANLDSYLGSGHNYYVYHDSLEGKFHFITWDCNEAFGNFNMGMSVSQLEQLPINWSSPPSGNRPLIEKMFADLEFRSLYEEVVCTYLEYWFSLNGMSDRIDSLANLIRPSVYADPIKFFTNQQFEDNLNSNINGCYAPRAQFTNVYINNQLWGLYTTVEEIDKTFLSKTFNDDKGNLFKGDPTGDLKWLGNSQALYEPKY